MDNELTLEMHWKLKYYKEKIYKIWIHLKVVLIVKPLNKKTTNNNSKNYSLSKTS